MLRKVLYGVGTAVVLSALFVFTVMAQTPETEEASVEEPMIEPILASLVQAVPVTLTLSVPGPTGTQTIQVPVVLSFDIQVGISNQVTTSVVVTAVDVSAGDSVSAESVEAEASPEATTGVSTPTPARVGVVPTATAAATATPVAATPTAVVTEVADDTSEPESQGAEGAIGEDETATEGDQEIDTVESGAEEAGAEEEGDGQAAPEDGAAEEVTGEACTIPGLTITSPVAGQVVSGTVRIEGTATHGNFDYYKLEYDIAGDDVENFVYLDGTETQVTAGLLGTLDSEEFLNGPLTVRLTVVDQTGNFPPPCEVTFVISN